MLNAMKPFRIEHRASVLTLQKRDYLNLLFQVSVTMIADDVRKLAGDGLRELHALVLALFTECRPNICGQRLFWIYLPGEFKKLPHLGHRYVAAVRISRLVPKIPKKNPFVGTVFSHQLFAHRVKLKSELGIVCRPEANCIRET